MKMISRIAVAAALGLVASPALAGGGAGCGGNCYREEHIPARYETETEQVMVRPPITYHKVIPAQYRTEAETVMVSPGGRTWQVSHDAWGHAIGCWVDVPPRYATRHHTVVVSEAQVIPVSVPAIYGTRSRTVEVEPARRAWVPVGGGYGYGYGHGGGLFETMFGGGYARY